MAHGGHALARWGNGGANKAYDWRTCVPIDDAETVEQACVRIATEDTVAATAAQLALTHGLSPFVPAPIWRAIGSIAVTSRSVVHARAPQHVVAPMFRDLEEFLNHHRKRDASSHAYSFTRCEERYGVAWTLRTIDTDVAGISVQLIPGVRAPCCIACGAPTCDCASLCGALHARPLASFTHRETEELFETAVSAGFGLANVPRLPRVPDTRAVPVEYIYIEDEEWDFQPTRTIVVLLDFAHGAITVVPDIQHGVLQHEWNNRTTAAAARTTLLGFIPGWTPPRCDARVHISIRSHVPDDQSEVASYMDFYDEETDDYYKETFCCDVVRTKRVYDSIAVTVATPGLADTTYEYNTGAPLHTFHPRHYRFGPPRFALRVSNNYVTRGAAAALCKGVCALQARRTTCNPLTHSCHARGAVGGHHVITLLYLRELHNTGRATPAAAHRHDSVPNLMSVAPWVFVRVCKLLC